MINPKLNSLKIALSRLNRRREQAFARNGAGEDKPLRPSERAARLCAEAKKMGLAGPTEGMIAAAICNAELDTLACYEIVAAHHGGCRDVLKLLLRNFASEEDKAEMWQRYVQELDSQ